eukprot:UN4725
MNKFCFAGAHTDQGILVHLATDGQTDRRDIHQGSWQKVGGWHFTRDPKPWDMRKLPELIEYKGMEFATLFRDLWTESQSALMKEDAECTAFYQQQFNILDTCYKEGVSSSQARECIANTFAL